MFFLGLIYGSRFLIFDVGKLLFLWPVKLEFHVTRQEIKIMYIFDRNGINTMSQNIALKFHFQWYLSQNFTVIVNTMCGVTPNG